MLNAILEALAARWRTLDPKLKYTVLSAAVSYTVLKAGIEVDADTAALITLGLSSAVGYRVPNDATVLRTEHEDGNARPPRPGTLGIPSDNVGRDEV